MHRSLPVLSAVFLGCAVPLAAQATLVVDAVGGPGTYPTLAAAEQAASHGDTILVVPSAVYDFGLTTGKGLTILGAGPGATQFHGQLRVDGLSVGRQFVLRNFASSAIPLNGRVRIDSCAGRVVLEELVLIGPPGGTGFNQGLAMFASYDVSAHHLICLGNAAVTMFGARLVASESAFVGEPSSALGTGGLGLHLYGSHAHLTNCTIAGPLGSLELSFAWSALPSVLTIAGGVVASGPTSPPALIGTASVLQLDAATFVTGSLVSPPGTVVPLETGRVAMTLAAAGQLGSIAMDGPLGAAGALAIGLPGLPGLPGAPGSTPLGDLWLDAPNFVIVAAGMLPLQSPIQMPAAGLAGQVLVGQGLLVNQGNLRLSGPVRATLP